MKTAGRSSFRASGAPRQSGGLPGLIVGALMVAELVTHSPVFAQSVSEEKEQHYEIPSQPIVQALKAFATVSGVSVIYGQSVPGEQRSTALDGTFPAPVALSRLLEGTGLKARFTSATSALIHPEEQSVDSSTTPSVTGATLPSLQLDMLEVNASPIIGRPSPGAWNAYAQRVQAEILDRIIRDGAYEGRRLRIVARVRVNASGRITEIERVHPSADQTWERIQKLLVGTLLSTPPPSDFSGSLRFEFEADPLTGSSTTGSEKRRP